MFKCSGADMLGGEIEPQWWLHSKEISRRGKLNARWSFEVSNDGSEWVGELNF